MNVRPVPSLGHTHIAASPPPRRITDAEGRLIDLRRYGDGPVDSERERLVEMYLDFDPSQRSLGLPPIRERRIREWLDVLLDGDNVLAWDRDKVIGQAVLVDSGEQECELAIFLHQDYHGAGIGTQLTETLLSYGKTRGIRRVWLVVERSNSPAVALYHDVGFTLARSLGHDVEMEIFL